MTGLNQLWRPGPWAPRGVFSGPSLGGSDRLAPHGRATLLRRPRGKEGEDFVVVSSLGTEMCVPCPRALAWGGSSPKDCCRLGLERGRCVWFAPEGVLTKLDPPFKNWETSHKNWNFYLLLKRQHSRPCAKAGAVRRPPRDPGAVSVPLTGLQNGGGFLEKILCT